MDVLIVEDDNFKFGAIKSVVIAAGVSSSRIQHASNSVDAYEKCKASRFDLLLLDVNIPRRFDEKDALRGEGISFLRRISRDTDIHKPQYIVGITAFDDVLEEFGSDFADELWSLVRYSEQSDIWKGQVTAKVEYVSALRRSYNFTDGRTFGVDVAVVCALNDPEWSALLALPCDWQPLRLPHDHTRYMTGTIETASRPISIVSAAAPRMGMPASAVLASKMVASFRPRILGMTGICAGRASKVHLGDAVIADPAYDWGSGKIDSRDNKPRFRPSPHQLDMNVDLKEFLQEFFKDPATRAGIRAKCPAPPSRGDLEVHIAPMASGAAVVANAAIFDELLDRNRDIAGLEMEAYGIFVAAMGCAKPRPLPLVIKGVCDFADEDKVDDYQSFAAHVSARCFYEAIKSLYETGRVTEL
ncbi:hypothetical protein [Sphingomonas faeni]|uniref:phosphorylase family protein n=1 Tax=Sphingomonas faeni TaxID=185950 RepID=UPI00334A02BB